MKRHLKIRNKKGRVTFDFYLDQFRSCFNDLALFFSDNLDLDLVVKENFRIKLEAIQSKRKTIKIEEFIKIDIAYTIAFIGLSQAGQKAIETHLDDRYDSNWIINIVRFLSLKPHPDSELYCLWKDLCDNSTLKCYIFTSNISNDLVGDLATCPPINKLYKPEIPFFKFFGGHQYKLSHYFRHLFHTVKFIHNEKILKEDEKTEYISVLRAQLSVPEQMLFAINAISQFGWEWEFQSLLDGDDSNLLITRYEIVKNIIDSSFDGLLDLKSFYPNILN